MGGRGREEGNRRRPGEQQPARGRERRDHSDGIGDGVEDQKLRARGEGSRSGGTGMGALESTVSAALYSTVTLFARFLG